MSANLILTSDVGESDVEQLTTALGGKRDAALLLIRNPGPWRHSCSRATDNDVKRLENRIKVGKKLQALVADMRSAMQNEPEPAPRREYTTVWSDLLARVDVDIARAEADLAQCRDDVKALAA